MKKSEISNVESLQDEKNTPKYNLFTAISLIIGIVIGSGIFFKSDDILFYTNENVYIGIFIFAIAAISIIFGSLTIAKLSKRTDKAGGIVNYFENFVSKALACVVGWFQVIIYFPAVIAIVAYVSGVYTIILFNLPNNIILEVFIGFIYMSIFYIQNIFIPKFGGYFQNISMIIKLIPLILVALIGIIWGNPSEFNPIEIKNTMESTFFLAAIVPIIFSFDGWIVATGVTHDIKNPKKNLTLALIISPIIILLVYILYFFGISSLLDVDKIVSLGDSHINVIANNLFGANGAKIMLTFVIISVLGTLNGLIIGHIRSPYNLAYNNYFPFKNKFLQLDKHGISKPSAALTFFLSLIFLLIHLFIEGSDLLPNSDISEISIVFNYGFLIFLYIAVIKMYFRKEEKLIGGLIIPSLAILGALIIVITGFLNPFIIYYICICLVVVISSLIYYFKRKEK